MQDAISKRGGGPNSSDYNEISSLTYVAIVFFAIEYLALFSGISLFFPQANSMRKSPLLLSSARVALSPCEV